MATVDHVVPRSRGGQTVPENLRLAHRRCNGWRGNELPELHWPDRFSAMDAAPLWQSLARIIRRRTPEIVAVLPTRELADDAATWALRRAQRFVGGDWSAQVEPTGAGESCVVRLRLDGDPDLPSAGKPVSDRRPRRR